MRIAALKRIAIVIGALLVPAFASAAEKDETALMTYVDKVYAGDATPASAAKIRTLIDKCKSCTGRALGRAYGALGLVGARRNQADEAKRQWSLALTYDPFLVIQATAFPDVRKEWVATAPEQDDVRRAGWILKNAYAGFKQTYEAALNEKWADCITKGEASIAVEDNAFTRLQVAECKEKTGKLVDALKDEAKALERARAIGDAELGKQIQDRVTLLVPRLGHLKLEQPAEVTELKVSFDERAIPEARLLEVFTVDPGEHKVHAEGVLRGARVFSDETIKVGEGEIATAKITMKPAAVTQGQLECMVSAKTQEDIAMCLPQQQKALVAHASLELSGYTDTLDVHILSPAVRGNVASPTQGWNVGASYLVDVVTAASPDVVASASRRFDDLRHDVSATGGYKPGNYGAQVSGHYSTEKDYISRTIGLTGIGDFRERSITPSLGYAFTWNTIGRAGTDYDVFSNDFYVHDVTAASTFLIDPTSLLVLGADLVLEDGNQSKPYRYIPLFGPGVTLPAGASPAEVNAKRLPTKPLEQLPLDRQRFSIAGRYIRRFGDRSTLRIDERLYRDTWEITASSTDFRWLIDLQRFRVGPHVHVHAQSAAKFYRRIYGAVLVPDGLATIPRFRTTDRELSPMLGITLGGTGRLGLTSPEAKLKLGVFASVDALYNHYLDSLYVTDRLAGYGTMGIEGDFE
jgi:hypothetical protein